MERVIADTSYENTAMIWKKYKRLGIVQDIVMG